MTECGGEQAAISGPRATTSPAAALIEQLRRRGDPWSSALGGTQRVMIAINQEMANPDALIRDGNEVALFPPVTGG